MGVVSTWFGLYFVGPGVDVIYTDNPFMSPPVTGKHLWSNLDCIGPCVGVVYIDFTHSDPSVSTCGPT